MRGLRLTSAIATCAAALAFSSSAAAAGFAPLDQPGPKLSASKAELRASLDCTGDLATTKRRPVLLLSGTTIDPVENFAWNWMPALTEAGYAWCAQTGPDPDNMADIQPRGENIVYALRYMHRVSGHKVNVYGHSQGGMVARWALRFWPDVRRDVGDVVGAAPSNRGTDDAVAICAAPCAESFWQQRTGADFLRALNSRTETFKGIAYTNIYTRLDEVVFPNTEGQRSSLGGPGRIANVGIQDVCPAATSEHLAIGTIDPVAWALFVDAITHGGPANPSRVDPGVCSEEFMPGVDPATVATDFAAAGAALTATIALAPRVSEEPALAPYVFKR